MKKIFASTAVVMLVSLLLAIAVGTVSYTHLQRWIRSVLSGTVPLAPCRSSESGYQPGRAVYDRAGLCLSLIHI